MPPRIWDKLGVAVRAMQGPLMPLRHPLAGSGKSTVAGIITESFLQGTAGAKETVVSLVPSRQLPDENALAADIGGGGVVGGAGMSASVLWIGRESEQTGVASWGADLVQMVRERLAPQIQHLKDIQYM